MTTAKRIFLVGDDHPLRQSLAEQLSLQPDFTVVEAAGVDGAAIDGAAAVLAVPTADEAALCRSLRLAGVDVPILLLTSTSGKVDAFLAPDCGASDVVQKPFRLGVLLTRLRTQLRLHEASGVAALRIGPFRFRPAAKQLDADDRRIRLTEKEAAILKYLHAADGQVVPRDELLGEVCGYAADVATHTLETHIYRLRRKIERDPAHAEILLTEGGGYRLVP